MALPFSGDNFFFFFFERTVSEVGTNERDFLFSFLLELNFSFLSLSNEV